MKLIFTWITITIFPSLIYGQKLTLVTALADSIKETSGLIYLNQKLITHNDSEGRAALYEIDTVSGNVTRSVALSNATNFDAEALISYGDSLYIFTKNWGDKWTNIYALPKTPGTYQISKADSINAQGLVTGASYNPLSKTILFVG